MKYKFLLNFDLSLFFQFSILLQNHYHHLIISLSKKIFLWIFIISISKHIKGFIFKFLIFDLSLIDGNIRYDPPYVFRLIHPVFVIHPIYSEWSTRYSLWSALCIPNDPPFIGYDPPYVFRMIHPIFYMNIPNIY